ncbi:MAG: DUF2288 family protein [Gammaproteobacteria bacterium]|nr:DUF2288 family protein [Gammaproteobacteria bacterium]
MNHDIPNPDRDEIKARLNAEAARISWSELERHYARGIVVRVAGDVDLIEVAVAMTLDEADVIAAAMAANQVAPATEDDARGWQGCSLWALVIAPWILVQERVGEARDVTLQ